MGLRGPPKQATNLRLMRGDPSKEGIPKGEPKPPEDTGDAPETLDGVSLEKWHSTVPKLKAMGVFTEADRSVWERYCIDYALWRQAMEMVVKYGDVMRFPPKKEGDPPYMQVSPFASQMMKYAASLLKIEMQFGLTPSSRTQVNIHATQADDPFTAFVKKRGDRAGA